MRNEINFVGACIGAGRGRRFQVDGNKVVVPKNASVYLAKIKFKTGNHEEETFKIFCIHDQDLGNFNEDDIQLIGKNIRNRFVFDPEFAEGMSKLTRMDKIAKVSLSDETRSNNKGS